MDIVTFTPAKESAAPDAGLGALVTDQGNLPLHAVDAAVTIMGLLSRTVLTQSFHNPHDVPVEATYIFPLPDRAAVTALRMTADGRVVEAELHERAKAREAYDAAVAAGKRAAIAEEERPDVFTMRVGNILPGEQVAVELLLVGPLSYEDDEATYRLPLVVAPRYIPGAALPGAAVGSGWADDTTAVPDASRITPPVLLPGFPNPVRLSIGVDIDPGGLPLDRVSSSLHVVTREGRHLEIRPGERADRDFILRLAYAPHNVEAHALTLTPDGSGDEGTFRLTVIPPVAVTQPRPRDVILVLDRSGSMQGWKMVAARRAAARIVDTLTRVDRFAVLTFDTVVEYPAQLPTGLVDASDRHRFRAVEHLARVEARGGTEMLRPLATALALLTDSDRDRVLVLVTDGQVGNEDEILASVAESLVGVRVHTVGIDQAVNAGFLGRLAALGGGRCELVESEDRLDASMDSIHRRIGTPVAQRLSLAAEGIDMVPATVSPTRLPDLFPGVPLIVTGRYRGRMGAVTVAGIRHDGSPWSVEVSGRHTDSPAVTLAWARAHLRDLEDSYAVGGDRAPTADEIVAASLRFGVLCRFTAWLAVDARVVTVGGQPHRVIQPVEQPAGWEMNMVRASTMVGSARLASFTPAAPMAQLVMPAPAARAHTDGSTAQPTPPMATPAAPGRRPIAGPARRKAGPSQPDAGDELASARSQVIAEARRLRTDAGRPEAQRREMLVDLASRLVALVRHLDHRGVDATVTAPLRTLAASLGGVTTRLVAAELSELWEEALRVLDAFGEDRAKSSFWTRRAR